MAARSPHRRAAALFTRHVALLKAKGHDVRETNAQGVAEIIVYDVQNDMLEGGVDRRQADGAAAAP